MGLFDRMKGLESLEHDWKELTDTEQIKDLIEESRRKPVVIFKHSIRCGTSAMVKWQLEKQWDFQPDELDFYYLDLIRHRTVSDAVAYSFDVVHQSPQVIIVHKGKAIYHTSHHMISLLGIRQAISGQVAG